MTARRKTQAPATKTTPVAPKAKPGKVAGKRNTMQAQAEPRTDFPIVGIGASAGGLAAFEAFFSGMPVNSLPGMAFVLVQHLAPDHKSILAELIKRCTSMEVFEVEDGMVVQANCTYIIPPNRDMAAGFGRFLPLGKAVGAVQPKNLGNSTTPGKMSLRELTEQALLRQVAPSGALVNGHGDILYLHGRTGMYLEPAPGEVGVYNILKMAREGLRGELTSALHRAAETKAQVRRTGLLVKTNGDFTPTTLTVSPLAARPESSQQGGEMKHPAATLSTSLYLIIFEEGASFDPEQARLAAAGDAEEGAADPDSSSEVRASARIAALRQELWAKEEYLQTANEELKSANEEMQSVNEELQSTNEELETSKEELQSINEELATINTELQDKVSDLSRANNDMNNLLAGTGIATVFVDQSLHILRFTSAVTGIINLISSDIGRPVSHIVSNLVGYDQLAEDVQSVLATLAAREVEVESTDGKWYILRIKDGMIMDVLMTSTALVNETGQVYAIATTERARGAKIGQPLGITQ